MSIGKRNEINAGNTGSAVNGPNTANTDKYPYALLLLYVFYFGGNGILNPFLPVYLDDIGLSQTLKGVLLALGLLVAVISQPFWGIAGDRARTKNDILKILFAACTAISVFFPMFTALWYVFAMYFLFMFFNASINPIADTIILDCLENSRWKFGPIRMGGTVGFALASVVAGFFVRNNIKNMFVMYSAVLFLNFLLIYRLPPVKGYQFGGRKLSPRELFKDKKLVFLMGFSFAIQITLGYYYSFFPTYFKQLGGDNTLLGWTMFVSAMSEVPFLLFADRIVKKLGTINTLACSALVISLRWLVLHLVTDAGQALLAGFLHGLTSIVFMYCLAVFINENAPKELRASGQTINGLLSMGAARIIGNVLGGVLSDAFGIRPMFLYISIVGFSMVVGFYALWKFMFHGKKA